MIRGQSSEPMRNERSEGARLVRVTRMCLALPEAQRELSGSHARFFVKTRTFAYFLDNHHGDGIVAVTAKVGRPEMPKYLELDPTRYYVPDYIGPKGWIALCLDVRPIDWKAVERLIVGSYRLTAPAKLATSV